MTMNSTAAGESFTQAMEAVPKVRAVSDLKPPSFYAKEKIEFVVEGILAAGNITMITGDAGSGKSTLITAMASCIERDIPFGGFATLKRPVLILDRENSVDVVNERLNRLGVSASDSFEIWGGWVEEEPPNAGEQRIIEYVLSCDPKPVVVLDSVAAFFDGDENQASDVRRFMYKLRRLAHLGAAVVTLHHSGKGKTSKDYRGSSDFKAAIDIGYLLTNLGDPFRLNKLKMMSYKARCTVKREIILTYVDGAFAADRKSVTPGGDELIRGMLLANPGVTTSLFEGLAGNFGVTREQARKDLRGAIKRGIVQTEKGTSNATRHYWAGPEAVAVSQLSSVQ